MRKLPPLDLTTTVLAALVVFFSSIVPVASSQTINGSITNADGQGLPGASVVAIQKSSGDILAGTSADANGKFSLPILRPGEFTVTASFVGLTSRSRNVTLTTGESVEMSFVLDRSTVNHPEMIVSAKRVERSVNPVTHSNITAEELEKRPAMKDLPVHLASTPSVTYYSENGNGIGYTTMRMRGFDQRRIAIAINGVPQNDPEEFNVFWINFFDIQSVVRDVQIQRGASGAYYGSSGIGGAINIITGPYRPSPDLTIEAGGGSYGTRRLSIAANSGIVGDKYRFFGKVSRMESDGYRNWSWTEFWRFFAGAQRVSSRSTLTLQAFGGPQRDGLAYIGIPKAANDGPVDDGFGGTIDRKYNYSEFTRDVEEFYQPHLELHHTFRMSDSTELEQTLFYVKGEGYFDFDGSFRSADYLRLPDGFVVDSLRAEPLFLSSPGTSVLFRAYLDQWQVGWYPRISHASNLGTTTVGLETRLHRSLRWGRVEESNDIPTNLLGDEDVRVYEFHGEKLIGSVLGSHVANLSPDVLVQGDLSLTWRRYRIFDEDFFGTSFSKPYMFVNPRIGVTLFPGKATSAYLSLAMTSREPRMKSLYDGEEAGAGFQPQFETNGSGQYDFDSPLVKPERMFNVEAGVNTKSDRYRVGSNVYLMYFVDEIVPSGGLDQFGVPRTGNADETIHFGIENEAAIRALPTLEVSGNLTLSRNRFVEFVEYDPFTGDPFQRKGNPIAGFPDVTAGATVTYTYQGLTALITSQFVGQQYIDNSGAENPDGSTNEDYILDPYFLANGSLNYSFADGTALQGLSAGIDVNNIANSQLLTWGNVSFGTPQFFPYAGRHMYFRLKYTLN